MTPQDFVPTLGLQKWHEFNTSNGKLKILKGPVWGKRVRSLGWSEQVVLQPCDSFNSYSRTCGMGSCSGFECFQLSCVFCGLSLSCCPGPVGRKK